MNICWILTILLSLCFSSTANVISYNIFDDLHVVQVRVNGTTPVCCPKLKGKNGEERLYTLLLGGSEIRNHSYDIGSNYSETVKEGLRIQVNKMEYTFKFVLSGITTQQAGVYTCKVQNTYPPPVEDVKEMCQTLVLVQDYQGPAGCEGHGDVGWIWKPLFWINLVYGLAVTIIALACCVRLRKGEGTQSDYMNTRPRAPPRVLKKNQGVQHPVRMGRY
ncbi:T-cell-specific surface glycoprotein CD28 [Esox lucius]|uniref:Immunoglobulin V-set domain-containing protein n=1 Tax=Esox lucius TaxID=8010 RepID=A0A6Q2WYC8_ESOLU|nr:T-cell-specific surface glycoprotein CD28 [Esox lucius]